MTQRWPDYVKHRLRNVYFYFGNAFVITSLSAVVAYNPQTENRESLVSLFVMMGSGFLAYYLPYRPGFGVKQIAWILYCRSLGIRISQLFHMGRPILLKSGFHTLIISSGLTIAAMYSPRKEFLELGYPLKVCLCVVLVCSVTSKVYPSASSGFHRFALYSGFYLFSAFILYDNERMIDYAEQYPDAEGLVEFPPFDPIAASLSVYLHVINVFTYLSLILSQPITLWSNLILLELIETHFRLWPDYVKKRIRTTYMYFGSSLIVTGASAIITFNSTSTVRLLVGRGVLSTLLLFGVIMITGSLAHSIPYKEGFGKKQLAWLVHTASLGTALAPLCFLGGPMLIRAATYTAGLIGGLTLVAVCAPGSKFLSLGGPLAMGLGVVVASSIGSMFFPATSTVGSGLHVIVVYGGLMLFSVMLLYDTQRIIFMAEKYPVNHEQYGLPPYDPINAALSIYTDALNIFSDILAILVESESRKRR